MAVWTRRGALGAGGVAAATALFPAVSRSQSDAPPADAMETARLIRAGSITAREAIEAAAKRLEAGRSLNAALAIQTRRALEALNRPDPPTGVPTLIKDLYDLTGWPTGQGSRAYGDAAPAMRQSLMITRLGAMGLVPLGKSTTPEFGLLPVTEPLSHGPTLNPWGANLSPGGSSGGAAAAVAAGLVPLAHGSDGGGSIRIPASCTGLFGYKPSRGRTVGSPRGDRVTDVTVEHVITRSVRDSALVLAACEPLPKEATYPAIGIISAPIKQRLRIGVVRNSLTGTRPDAEVDAGITATVALLEGLGHTVVETAWPVDGQAFARDFLALWALGAKIEREAVKTRKGESGVALLEPFTRALAADADQYNTLEQVGLVGRLGGTVRRYRDWFGKHDVVLSPVLSRATIPTGSIDQNTPYPALVAQLTELVGYTPLANITGGPAMSVPLHWTDAGLPVGMQFAARPGNDATLLGLALELEQAKPWARRIPPIWFGT